MSLRSWVPRWWAGECGVAGRVADVGTAPAEAVYRGIVSLRNAGYDHGLAPRRSAPIPVISVGNLAVGGAGKTPVSAWVAARLGAWGRRPAIVLRGYGQDEVLVHRALNPAVPVVADADRLRAVQAAARDGSDCAVLDDGFQHRRLARELDIVLVAAEGWSRHPRLLPRGPWRETPGALARAGGVLVTRKSASAEERDRVLADLEELVGDGTALAACHLAPTRLRPLHEGRRLRRLEWLRGREVLAVAALATPGPFVAQLEAAGARVEAVLFGDHHEYQPAEARRIIDLAAARPLVTTLKDAVKLKQLLDPQVEAWVLEQSVRMEVGGESLDAALRRALEARPG